ncbi:MAG TPA: hypothetical protein VF613_25190 [Longimicrobium sp.]|jgi:hypothetical protein
MYPADDIPILLGLTARRSQALQDDIESQLARMCALYERARVVSRHPDLEERAAELIRDVHETVRTSQELIASAREHGDRSRLLVQRSQTRRRMRASGA